VRVCTSRLPVPQACSTSTGSAGRLLGAPTNRSPGVHAPPHESSLRSIVNEHVTGIVRFSTIPSSLLTLIRKRHRSAPTTFEHGPLLAERDGDAVLEIVRIVLVHRVLDDYPYQRKTFRFYNFLRG